MKKDRFLWSAHRITERQKAGKARSIKGKQLKNSRSTASRLLVARPSSASAEFPSVPSILRPMAVMAVMGAFLYAVGFVQKICLYGNHGKPCRAGILRTFQA